MNVTVEILAFTESNTLTSPSPYQHSTLPRTHYRPHLQRHKQQRKDATPDYPLRWKEEEEERTLRQRRDKGPQLSTATGLVLSAICRTVQQPLIPSNQQNLCQFIYSRILPP